MVRRILVSLCGLLALAAAPGARAETVIAYFDGVIGGPGPNNAATGAAPMTGWAVSPSGIAKVILQVDGVDVGQAYYGMTRPDVTAIYPGYADSPAPGFGYHLNSTDFPNGIHRVSAKVFTNAGDVVIIGQQYDLYFNNNPSILPPFGAIDTPRRNQDLYGTCDISSPNRLLTPVTGWALDLGIEEGDTGIGYVELMVDGVIVPPSIFQGLHPITGLPIFYGSEFNTRSGCFWSYHTGGLTNCYGFPRQDVEQSYPFALNAPSAGYRFVLDVGYLVGQIGFNQGAHYLTVRAGDVITNVKNIAEIPVNFLCEENVPDMASFGDIESPRENRLYEGVITFQGWALDIDGIDHVDIWVDGVRLGTADYGVDSRPFVFAAYPGYPDALAPVWRFNWDSNQLADGVRQLQVYAVDERGISTLFGERSFHVDNVDHTP